MKTRSFYMHTIDDRPCQFQTSTKTICYAGRVCTRLATSLRQIRAEQAIDRAGITGRGVAIDFKYGYVRIPAAAVLKS